MFALSCYRVQQEDAVYMNMCGILRMYVSFPGPIHSIGVIVKYTDLAKTKMDKL